MRRWLIRREVVTIVAAILVMSLALSISCAKAETGQAAKEFYQGKTITLYTGSAGGTGDLISRTLAPFVGKETGTTVVVENQPGSNIQQNLNLVYQSKPDGLTLYLGDPTSWALSDWLKEPGALWDTAKFNWLAQLAIEPTIYLQPPQKPVNSINDLRQAKGLKYGTPLATSWHGMAEMSLCSVLDLDAKVVTGFKGSTEMVLSVIKGELDGCMLVETLSNQYVKSGQLKPLFVYYGQSTTFSSLPLLEKEIKPTKQQQTVRDFVGTISKNIATGPGVPQDRVDFLRSVLKKICEDPITQQEIVKKAGMSGWYGLVPGEEVQKRMGQKDLGPQIASLLQGLQQKYLVR